MRSRFLLFGFLVGMVVLVLAASNDIALIGDDVTYTIIEDATYLHDFISNITGTGDDISFSIYTDATNKLKWNGVESQISDISSWIFMENVSLGHLRINATNDSQTGFFEIPISVSWNNVTTGGHTSGTIFEFQVNAVNDIPIFSLDSNYSMPISSTENATKNITLDGADEEKQYPLVYNISFNNCSFASWSSRTNADCNLSYDMISSSNTTSILAFKDLSYNDIGSYNLTICVTDNINGTGLPPYYDSNYLENKTRCHNTTLDLLSSLSINVSDCDGGNWTEGDTLDCTIEITTIKPTDNISISSVASFIESLGTPHDNSWFYPQQFVSAVNYAISLNISIIPPLGKKEVGNWTIEFTADDGSATASPRPISETILMFVNYNESNVELQPISDLIGLDTLYGDDNFTINVTDSDLLIRDDTIKDETFFIVSNVSWVTIDGFSGGVFGVNHWLPTVYVNHSYVINNASLGNGTYSVNISVTDGAFNSDWKVFAISLQNETAPDWNLTENPVILELVENGAFSYNVSMNVSDPGETIDFSYANVSGEFCSLTDVNFNSSSGIISFIPSDCDVGYNNVRITADNGKLSSYWDFIFNVSNIYDLPIINDLHREDNTTTIDNGSLSIVSEGSNVTFVLDVKDDDFLVLQKSFYDEVLTIDVIFNNSGVVVDLFNFSFEDFYTTTNYVARYNATFSPKVADVGNYTVFLNITDVFGYSINRTWFLSVVAVPQAPVLENVSNVSLTIHDYLNFTLNATDNEDGYFNRSLNYSVVALDVGAPDLVEVNGSVYLNMSSDNSYGGIWRYNVTVNDSDSMIDWRVFYLSVYGFADLNLPVENSSFDLIENVSKVLNFTVNHSVGDDLVYEFWIDNMTCFLENGTDLNCSYGNLSLRDSVVSFGNGSALNWSFLPDFRDETYGLKKNLTVRVYPNATNLSLAQKYSVASSFSFKFNITHSNAPMRAIEGVAGSLEFSYASVYDLDLSDYFEDEDINDPYYSQNISFEKYTGTSDDIYVTYSSGWIVKVGTTLQTAHDSVLYVEGSDNLTSDVSGDINIKFTAPSTQTSSGGSSSKTVIKFYSLRIIVPEDVIISPDDYIEIPFGLENTGTIDLQGIDLSSQVLYNNAFSDDVKVDLGVDYIDSLKSGERKEFTMKILADTDRAGRYKATIFANISSPKFQDWADFFIDLRKTNESEAEELLIFTEKMVADNPECLELTEVFRRAKEMFEAGNTEEALRLAEEVSSACEDAIMANEQIRYRIEGFVEKNFYYISFLTLSIFFVGFIFYVYKRVRFNKSVEDEYSRGSDTDGK